MLEFDRFINEEDGMGVVEVILIIVDILRYNLYSL